MKCPNCGGGPMEKIWKSSYYGTAPDIRLGKREWMWWCSCECVVDGEWIDVPTSEAIGSLGWIWSVIPRNMNTGY